jgi:hypothetical protein
MPADTEALLDRSPGALARFLDTLARFVDALARFLAAEPAR